MLNYLDGYPLTLPCRYANKVACFTKVYLVTNIPLEEQYPNIQQDSPETWNAFRRRIHSVRYLSGELPLLPDDPEFDPETIFAGSGV